LGKEFDSWSGAIPVSVSLNDLSTDDYSYARVKITNPIGVVFYKELSWNPTTGKFEGVIHPGSNYGLGCADPNVGVFQVEGQLSNAADFSEINYVASLKSFTTFIARRGYISYAEYDYPTFIPTWDTDHWHHEISTIKAFTAGGTYSNVAVAFPFHPITTEISNIAVTVDGTAVSQGNASSTSRAWWWNEDTHILYVQMASLGTGVVSIGIEFDSTTDLFATRLDRDWTTHIAFRDFYNGLVVSNQYLTTRIYGGGHEGAGMQVDLHTKLGDEEIGVDCIERVGIHVDDTTRTDNSGYYMFNIKWDKNEWPGYITSENDSIIIIENNSDATPTTGWVQGLQTGISAKRTLSFYAGEKFIKNNYQLTNNGETTRKFPFVWGREQWIQPDRNTNDQGRIYGDLVDRSVESSAVLNRWVLAYDTISFMNMGVIFKAAESDLVAYFLSTPALYTDSARWPITLIPGGETNNNTFFAKTWNEVAADETVEIDFWQWTDPTVDALAEITDSISADYSSVNG